jgi:hypothetical protein
VNTVQIGNINGSLVWSGVLFVVLINIQSEKHHVHPIELLEHNQTLAAERKLFWIILVSVSLPHQVSDIKLPVA